VAYDPAGFLDVYDAVLNRWSVPVEMLELVSRGRFSQPGLNAGLGPAAWPLLARSAEWLD
jgi:hypothetical protein